jgi:protein-S-isoprenylcysteine O-methyltransferase Ste14
MSYLELIYIIPLGVVAICWIVFAVAFIFRKRPENVAEQKRDPKAMIGVALEAIGYAIVWMLRRETAYLLPLPGIAFDIFIGLIICVLAIASVWLVTSAIKTLGKQWAVAARVVEGHRLITTGPYARVRNPIYSGMFGMLIATGLALTTWYGIVIGVVLFWFGTIIRVKVEEKLLRETFGAEFDAYAKLVAQLIPRLF